MNKLSIGLFFGGRTTEHEVSVITALQAYENLDKTKYEVTPIYISKAGDFYTNSKFLDLKNYQDINGLLLSSQKVTLGRKDNKGGYFTTGFMSKFIALDVVMPMIHGSFGEDGCLQGVFETYQIPYTSFNVMGSAVGMDKVVSKAIFKSLGFEVSDFAVVTRNEWLTDSAECIK